LAVGQILGLLARTPSGAVPLNDVPSADWLHHYTEVSRLTFADRALYVADPDFVTAPGGKWTSLLAPGYLDERAKLISATRMQDAPAGHPGPKNSAWAPMPDQPEYGTSHISIVDGAGRAVAMTTTIEAGFGSRMMVTTGANGLGGFLLNNELTDFSFAPADALGKPIANRVEPGKRPRSSMSPTLVFDAANDQLLMSVGSPGGSSIIHYTAKTLLGVFNGGLTPQAAIDLPNFANTGGPLLLEQQRFPPATVEALKQKGHTVNETEMTSGLQAIVRGQAHGETFWFGGADPRREGVVMGD
jgi:gamma-glutamyltranspeptidase/glutathione hydrolase